MKIYKLLSTGELFIHDGIQLLSANNARYHKDIVVLLHRVQVGHIQKSKFKDELNKHFGKSELVQEFKNEKDLISRYPEYFI